MQVASRPDNVYPAAVDSQRYPNTSSKMFQLTNASAREDIQSTLDRVSIASTGQALEDCRQNQSCGSDVSLKVGRDLVH
jgi:hypothetical protein